MRIIPLQQTPSQSLSIRLEDRRFALRIKQGNGTMLFDCDCDDINLIKAQRILANMPIFPYLRLEKYGNFLLLTDNDTLPDWQYFGINQKLIYVSPAEIQTILS